MNDLRFPPVFLVALYFSIYVTYLRNTSFFNILPSCTSLFISTQLVRGWPKLVLRWECSTTCTLQERRICAYNGNGLITWAREEYHVHTFTWARKVITGLHDNRSRAQVITWAREVITWARDSYYVRTWSYYVHKWGYHVRTWKVFRTFFSPCPLRGST